MTRPALAFLSSEIPSPSATFVVRELSSMRRQGVEVVPFALRMPESDVLPIDGIPLLVETEYLYGRGPVRLLVAAFIQCVLSPWSSVKALGLAFRDVVLGDFNRPLQRVKVLGQVIAGLALARSVLRSGATHLHIQFAHAPATVGMYAAIASGLRFSITGHAHDLFCEASLLREKIERSAVFRTISRANRRALIDDLGEIAERVEVVYCGVDRRMHEFTPLAERDPEHFLFVGRLVPKKGADLAIRALGRLVREAPERGWRLTVVGDGPERNRLHAMAAQEGVDDRVDLLGYATDDRLIELRRRAGALVLPCRRAHDGDRDGIPLVLMEAMAEGLPVVTSNLEGLDELVADCASGFVHQADDVENLADTLRRLVDSPNARAAVTQAAAERIAWHHDVDHQARRVLELIGMPSSPLRDLTKPQDEADLVVVTPFRNEAEHLGRVIPCMKAQTARPRLWVLVDDGSTDGGDATVREAARECSWIRYERREDRGARVLGAGVIEAFDRGLSAAPVDSRFIAKMDADLSFGPRYLETALAILEADDGLACVSGKVFRPEAGGAVEEFMIDEMVAGQFKLYRRDAFEDIGGFVQGLLWDGIDYHRCRQFGWRTRSLRHPDLRIGHHRLMGSSDGNVLRGRLRLGRGQWFMGTHPLYLLASAVFRMLEKPYLIGGGLIILGYFRAMALRLPRYQDLAFRSELRGWQLGRLRLSSLRRAR